MVHLFIRTSSAGILLGYETGLTEHRNIVHDLFVVSEAPQRPRMSEAREPIPGLLRPAMHRSELCVDERGRRKDRREVHLIAGSLQWYITASQRVLLRQSARKQERGEYGKEGCEGSIDHVVCRVGSEKRLERESGCSSPHTARYIRSIGCIVAACLSTALAAFASPCTSLA